MDERRDMSSRAWKGEHPVFISNLRLGPAVTNYEPLERDPTLITIKTEGVPGGCGGCSMRIFLSSPASSPTNKDCWQAKPVGELVGDEGGKFSHMEHPPEGLTFRPGRHLFNQRWWTGLAGREPSACHTFD